MIKFHGPSPAIERFFGAADAFVLPTRFDIFGQVVLEAMAAGVPPVVSAAAGAAECVRDGETGYVLEDSRDARKLAEHMRALASDDALRARLAARAVEHAKTYSWDRHFARVLQIYEDVARTKRESGAAALAAPS
jgi:glycosyltransferase involved in cell wall biosynthesis